MQVKWNSELPYVQQPAHCYLEDSATELQGITPHPLPHDYTLCKIPSFCVGGQCDENPRIPAHPLYAFHTAQSQPNIYWFCSDLVRWRIQILITNLSYCQLRNRFEFLK